MPYYGDYYAGDPGLFGFVKKIGGAVIKSILPGPARTILDVGSKLFGQRPRLGGKPEVQAVGAPMQVLPLAQPSSERRTAVRRKPSRRSSRKLKFGSPAWRRKYLR